MYWDGVLDYCDEFTRILPDDKWRLDLNREVFSFGGIANKSYSLRAEEDRLKSLEEMDRNEVAAIDLVRTNFPDVPVPRIYFASKARLASIQQQ